MLDPGSLATLEIHWQILPPLVEGALLSTAQVASHLCGIPFEPTDSVDETFKSRSIFGIFDGYLFVKWTHVSSLWIKP